MAAGSASPIHAVSIDPADYLQREHDAATLVKQLVNRFSASGVNLIYVNAYNVEYGAYYQTNYRYNQENQYGQQDFLGKLVSAAHARGIRVFAAFYDHQHRGAWEHNSSWRAMRLDGSPYNPPGTDVQYYLSVADKNAVSWWDGFLKDILSHYPKLDGVELREPIISWWGTEADHNPAFDNAFKQAFPGAQVSGPKWLLFRRLELTAFLKQETHLVHSFKRQVHVTSVVSVHPDGSLLSLNDEANATGFDVKRLMAGADAPDVLKGEFIWQQWANVYGYVAFTPEWTRRAIDDYLSMTGLQGKLLVHVELTDFGRSLISADEFYRTLRYADAPGTAGVDFYSAALADQKHAWPGIKAVFAADPAAAAALPKDKRALILYDATGDAKAKALARMQAVYLANLLGHFPVKWEIRPVGSYRRGDLDGFGYAFYLGTSFGDAPQSFLSDASVFAGKLTWIGQNLHELVQQGVKVPFLQPNPAVTTETGTLSYRGHSLPAKGDLIVTSAGPGAVVRATIAAGGARYPYALEAGHFWYFSGSPFIDLDQPNGRYLAFADLLYEIIGTKPSAQGSYLGVTGISPLSDPTHLRALADVFAKRHAPFLISVTPVYVDPSRHLRVALDARPKVVSALRYMQEQGGVVVMDGDTHQATGVSSPGYEFWNPVSQTGVASDGNAFVNSKLNEGLQQLWGAGLHPLAWTTPGYRATSYDYSLLRSYFSTFIERRLYGVVAGFAYEQALPYAINADVYGAAIIPENLDYGQGRTSDLLAAARSLSAVRGAVAVGFVDASASVASLAQTIDGVRRLGFKPLDLYARANVVHAPWRVEVSGSAKDSIVIQGGPFVYSRQYDRRGTQISQKVVHYTSYGRPTVRAHAAVGSLEMMSAKQYYLLTRGRTFLGVVISKVTVMGLISLLALLSALSMIACYLRLRLSALALPAASEPKRGVFKHGREYGRAAKPVTARAQQPSAPAQQQSKKATL